MPAGRPTSGAGLLEGIGGSSLAKRRLWAFVETLSGKRTVVSACEELGLCESALYKMRSRWLEEALELLEPRKPGRRPKAAESEGDRVEALEEEIHSLRRELRAREVREEIAVTMPRLAGRIRSRGKKTT